MVLAFFKPARIIRFAVMTFVAFSIFSLLNYFIAPSFNNVNEEVEVIRRMNHLEFAEWERNRTGPGELGTPVVLRGREKAFGEESMKKWFMNLYVRFATNG